jgi:peptidoglycan/LPS O-acetylase OafA/YrhL
MSATNTASNLKALTGIRFWAALIVVLFHFAGSGVSTHEYLINPLIARGSMGVDLFFILSGYIIHHVYNATFSNHIDKSAYRKFISFRIARMYPVHVFTLALMYLLYIAATVFFNKTPADNDS